MAVILKLTSRRGTCSDAKPGLFALVTLLIWRLSTVATADTFTCPSTVLNATWGTCKLPCQQAICEALASFYESTNFKASSTSPGSWRQQRGWTELENLACRILVAEDGTGSAPVYCSWHGVTCCSAALRSSGYCTVNNSVWGLQLPVNGLTGSLEGMQLQRSLAQLHACGLMKLNLAGNALSGSLDNFCARLPRLITLNLSRNRLHGTIPDALRNLTMLKELRLDRNPMHGTIPEWISELQSLRTLYMAALTGFNTNQGRGLVGTIPASISSLQHLLRLVLRVNSLTGTLPPGVCQHSLSILDLQGNKLTGRVDQLFDCPNLRYMDVSDNRLNGSLPDTPYWNLPKLNAMYMTNNDITGSLPAAFYKLPQPYIVRIAHNRLSATISPDIRRMLTVMELDLSHNQLTGELIDSLWHMYSLAEVDLSYNNLTGTLSKALGLSLSLWAVRLDGNKLTGQIPPNMALPSVLDVVSLTNNLMSCSSGNEHGNSSLCGREDLLPCFLGFSPVLIPRPDASSMECPVVTRKATDAIIRDCQGPRATQLGPDASGDKIVLYVDQQRWSIDPAYFQFQGCRCLRGYEDVWNSARTVLTCVPVDASTPGWIVPTAAATGTIGIVLLVVVSLLAWFKVAVQYRRKWQRERELLRHRQKGVPSGGPASIVVTDVEGYSELMRVIPGPATQAMGIHNAILRKAVAVHAGHVIEQEGDSWSVAFHRPVEAVAFCLQVQQALHKGRWPSQLAAEHPSSGADSGSVECSGHSTEPPAVGLIGRLHSSDRSGSAPSGPGVHGTNSSEGGAAVRSMQRLTGAEGRHNKGIDDGLSVESTSNSDCVRTGAVEAPRRASLLGPSTGGYTGGIAVGSRTASVASLAGPGRIEQHTADTKGKTLHVDGVINGLRVRMGIASGWVPSGTDITRSVLFGTAKAVSDLANGGQTLMDCGTAAEVRLTSTALGGVDHKGYNDDLLSVFLPHSQGVLHNAVRRVVSVITSLSKSSRSGGEPLLLDMGQYWMSSANSCCVIHKPSALAKAVGDTPAHDAYLGKVTAAAMAVAEACGDNEDASSKPLAPCSRAAIVAAAVAALYGVEAADAYNKLSQHIFSIVAQPLHQRSKLWLNQFNLTEGTQQMTKSYFSAPGSIIAELSPSAKFLDRPLLPPVTLVCAAVDEGRLLVRKNEHVAAYLHKVLIQAMQALLMCFPDGYLCHTEAAEMKYMLAFSAPKRAAEWALLLQDVLQHVPWPATLLPALPARRSHHSLAGDRLMSEDAAVDQHWAGVKFGLAQGVPDSVSPNQLGHAQYSGGPVDLVDCILSTAAQPGQILLLDELAQKVMMAWHGRNDANTAPHQQCKPADASPVSWPVLSAKPTAGNMATAAATLTSYAGLADHLANPVAIVDGGVTATPMPRVGGSGSGDVHEEHTPQYATGTLPLSTFSMRSTGKAASRPGMPPGSITHAVAEPVAAGSNADAKQLMHVTANPVGRYTFKGVGAVDLVSLASEAVPEAQQSLNSKTFSAVVALPEVLSVFQDAWQRLATVEPNHTASLLLGEGTLLTGRQKRSRDSATRTAPATADY